MVALEELVAAKTATLATDAASRVTGRAIVLNRPTGARATPDATAAEKADDAAAEVTTTAAITEDRGGITTAEEPLKLESLPRGIVSDAESERAKWEGAKWEELWERL